MKITVAAVHNWVVEAEGSEDIALLEAFIDGVFDRKNQFWLHGYCHWNGRNRSFNFGFIEKYSRIGNTVIEEFC